MQATHTGQLTAHVKSHLISQTLPTAAVGQHPNQFK